ncbi:UDP-N-acetylmuramate dehydrogenase [Vibrio hippocampi]|uniref:UDP-N-acetylenolpyruvoylglucosamine reductase n=1 Tax=Vibrio hippocampi TaxID=654686 RepID=A0ABM8ZLU5_9VIBR|nr:UDP-N-acetylmuramate dehydrogenase [Vibrio hippocampi]CAH0527305.1 UDP-N-acetylenolpyruvoylglucosamine reductase [Vibrio hippocampi]
MQIQHNAQLSHFHTFGIAQTCAVLAKAQTIDDLIALYRDEQWQAMEKLMLGKGSNMLFTQPYQGLVVVNQLMGREHRQDSEYHYLHVSGGEDWPELVEWATKAGFSGLENLALIPGCTGSAPIQNIGAYGVEFKDICEYVDYLCLESFEVKRLTQVECQFGYRDSIFKHQLKDRAIITAVGIKLAKQWQPNLNYGPLQQLDEQTVTAQQIFDIVVDVRQQKLPDPEVTGNAGSFFKNPVISQQQYQQLNQLFPNLVAYPAGEQMKLAAGWLIDQCGLKGYTLGGAMVHPNQALVLVNAKQATAQDVVALAAYVRDRVLEKFNVELEHEVRFMGALNEVYLRDLV